MVVRTQSDGRVVTGLYIGTRNARRRFPKCIAAIELQLGHVQIRCALEPEFWRGRPEIHDQRLCDWLESSLFHGRSCRIPIPLLMSLQERNVYGLQPLLPQSRSANTRESLRRLRPLQRRLKCARYATAPCAACGTSSIAR